MSEGYKELLEQVIIFLGGPPPNDVKFYHLEGWIAKAMHCLKIFLFRKQSNLTNQKLVALKRIGRFLIINLSEAI